MLKTADERDYNELEAFLDDSIISLRIMSYIKAYGFSRDFLKFWISYDKSGVNAVVSLFENSVLISASRYADFSELSAFLSMLSFDTLSCSDSVASSLGIMSFDVKQGYVFSGDSYDFSADNIAEGYLKDVYKLICENIPGSFVNTKEAYLSFLSDYTFRERRNLARGKCVLENGMPVACAITAAETDGKALLSGVAADKNCKKRGYGKRVVLSLVNELLEGGKTPYVIALNDSAKGFYEHIGFKKVGLIAYVNRKDL